MDKLAQALIIAVSLMGLIVGSIWLDKNVPEVRKSVSSFQSPG